VATTSPVNVYDCLFLLDTTKVAGDEAGAAQVLHGILEKHGATILASRRWDERKLAYPIGNQKKGLYWLTYFQAPASSLPAMEPDFAICELVIRKMVYKIEAKWVETMLTVAKDERALALQIATDDSLDAGFGGGGGGDRGDRGGRRDRGFGGGGGGGGRDEGGRGGDEGGEPAGAAAGAGGGGRRGPRRDEA
jgi:small subunit ribosomal protein S6